MAYQVSFDGPILVIRLFGSLTATDLDTVADEVLAIEQGGTHTPPRMIDLRGVTEALIGYADMARVADRSRVRPLMAPIRSAMVVSQPVHLGFARMFQILNEHPQITMRIFEDDAPAREWLASSPSE